MTIQRGSTACVFPIFLYWLVAANGEAWLEGAE